MDESLTCKHCSRIFTEPVTLSCGHSLCFSCAKEQFCYEIIKSTPRNWNGTSGKIKGKIVCAECGQEQFENPDANLRNVLQPNVSIQKRIEANAKPTCCNCEKEAVLECQGCSQEKYCYGCFESAHSSHPVFKKHQSQPLQKQMEDTMKPYSVCSKHQELNKLYCTRCEEVLCSMCALYDHSGHHFISISDAAQAKTVTLDQHVESIKHKMEALEAEFQLAQQELVNIKQKRAPALKEIKHYFEEIRRFMQMQEDRAVASYLMAESAASSRLTGQQQRLELLGERLSCLVHPASKQHEAIINTEKKMRECIQTLKQKNTNVSIPTIKIHARVAEMKKLCEQFVEIEQEFALSKNATVTTVAGSGVAGFKQQSGDLTKSQFEWIASAVVTDDGVMYVADQANHLIRKIDFDNNTDEIFAGSSAGCMDGHVSEALFNKPACLALDYSKQNMYVTEFGNSRVRKVHLPSKIVTTVPLPHQSSIEPVGICLDRSNNLYISDASTNSIYKVTENGSASVIIENGVEDIRLICLNPHNERELFISDSYSIHKLDVETKTLSLLCGGAESGYQDNQDGKQARFAKPVGMCVFADKLLIADRDNHRVRAVDIATGAVETFAGDGNDGLNDGKLQTTSFDSPTGVLEDKKNQCLYVTTSTTIKRIQ